MLCLYVSARAVVTTAVVLVWSMPCKRTSTTRDGGVRLTESRPARQRLLSQIDDAKLLRWVLGMDHISRDAGVSRSFEQAAELELAWRAASGLSDQEIEDIELLVSTVVTQRKIAALSGADAVRAFERASQALRPLKDAGAGFESDRLQFEFERRAEQSTALKMLEIQFGTEVLQAVLRNEAALTRAWEQASVWSAPLR
jgi:hypothetical protein